MPWRPRRTFGPSTSRHPADHDKPVRERSRPAPHSRTERAYRNQAWTRLIDRRLRGNERTLALNAIDQAPLLQLRERLTHSRSTHGVFIAQLLFGGKLLSLAAGTDHVGEQSVHELNVKWPLFPRIQHRCPQCIALPVSSSWDSIIRAGTLAPSESPSDSSWRADGEGREWRRRASKCSREGSTR